jgi:hypothetical protein
LAIYGWALNNFMRDPQGGGYEIDSLWICRQ